MTSAQDALKDLLAEIDELEQIPQQLSAAALARARQAAAFIDESMTAQPDEHTLDKCQADLVTYKPGKTPDWDSGMIAVAIYRAMLAASPPPPVAESGWQEIETAPKDGRLVLIFHPADDDGETVHVGHFVLPAYKSQGNGGWRIGKGWIALDEPTHWRPLPAPPAIVAEKREKP